MTGDGKWPRAEALVVAHALVDVLSPFCERIEIAGSIRRNKARVGDIEILYIPMIARCPDPADLFGGEMMVDAAREQINDLVGRRVIERRRSIVGVEAWGEKNKLATHVASGIPVDFFSTTEENWWVSLVVRTGGLESNLQLTKAAQERGRSLLAYGCGVKQLSTGQVTRAESEREVFQLCGCPYLEPEDRS